MKQAKVIAVSSSPEHGVGKINQSKIKLIENLGVEGDAHFGKYVQHLSRLKENFEKPNLRQVHLIHQELIDELIAKGFNVAPGIMGENITTQGIDILDLPENTILSIGSKVQIKVTGLRTPCHQLNGIQEGLMDAVLDKDEYGELIRKSGVMG